MLTGRKKLLLTVFMFLNISSLLVCLSLKQIVEVAGDNREQLPIRSFTITIDPSQREKVFDQLHRFADKHGLEFTSTDYGTNGARFLVEILGKDIKILAVDIPKAPKMIAIDFYDQSLATPVAEETLDKIDDLASDLKSFISEIPNVLITEKRKGLTITIDESQREELFAQMRKLADEHSLEFKLSFSSDKTVFHLEIHGEGFHITGDPVIGYPRKIFFASFIDYYKAPTPTSLETVEELFYELTSRLSKIPNVTITEEQ